KAVGRGRNDLVVAITDAVRSFVVRAPARSHLRAGVSMTRARRTLDFPCPDCRIRRSTGVVMHGVLERFRRWTMHVVLAAALLAAGAAHAQLRIEITGRNLQPIPIAIVPFG